MSEVAADSARSLPRAVDQPVVPRVVEYPSSDGKPVTETSLHYNRLRDVVASASSRPNCGGSGSRRGARSHRRPRARPARSSRCRPRKRRAAACGVLPAPPPPKRPSARRPARKRRAADSQPPPALPPPNPGNRPLGRQQSGRLRLGRRHPEPHPRVGAHPRRTEGGHGGERRVHLRGAQHPGGGHASADAVERHETLLAAIRDDLRRTLHLLPSPVARGSSPPCLAALGESISEALNARRWAARTAQAVREDGRELLPYCVQEFCRDHVRTSSRTRTSRRG